MSERGLVIGVDIGTSSTKGVLVGLDGTVHHTVVVEHEVSRPHPGHVEMDGAIWWDEFQHIARALVDSAEAPILSVGVSGMGPCLLLADAAGQAIRPGILYGVDSRAGVQIERMNRELDQDELLARAGSLLSSQAVGPKLAWIAENEPEHFARARRMFMPASWLSYQLTGEYTLDHHSASQSTPLYDTTARDWYRPWADPLIGEIELPRLAWPGEVAGRVHAEAAAVTGLPEGIPVIVGTIDAWTEAISVGGQTPGDLMLMYGTTLFMVNTSSAKSVHPALWGTVGAFPGTYNLAAGMATSGAITAWLRDLFGTGYPELLAEAEQSPPGSRGLLMLPYFAGERTPINDPDARGLIAGLTIEHGRGDLYRAALEATAFGIRHNVEQMRAAGAVIERIVAVGGGTKGSLWTQIVSDVTGLVQEVAGNTIGASFGAAFLAASAIESVSIQDWNPKQHEVVPDAARHEFYSRLFQDYLALYPATAEVSHRLAAQQHSDARQDKAARQNRTAGP